VVIFLCINAECKVGIGEMSTFFFFLVRVLRIFLCCVDLCYINIYCLYKINIFFFLLIYIIHLLKIKSKKN